MESIQIVRVLYTCKRCTYQWFSKKKPTVCARCHSPYWDKDKKIKLKEDKNVTT
jgi:rubrerythrin